MASSYGYLGSRGPITGTPDATGLNTGNWTVAVTPAILNFTVPEAFIYKMNMEGALGSSFNVMVENKQHDVNVFGSQNSWFDNADDSLVLRPTENLYLLYSDPITDGTPPVVWVFLRYDVAKWGMNYG